MLKCNNIKIDNDEIINENGDVYKILSREQQRYNVRYVVTLKMRNMKGGCQCPETQIQQAY